MPSKLSQLPKYSRKHQNEQNITKNSKMAEISKTTKITLEIILLILEIQEKFGQLKNIWFSFLVILEVLNYLDLFGNSLNVF